MRKSRNCSGASCEVFAGQPRFFVGCRRSGEAVPQSAANLRTDGEPTVHQRGFAMGNSPRSVAPANCPSRNRR